MGKEFDLMAAAAELTSEAPTGETTKEESTGAEASGDQGEASPGGEPEKVHNEEGESKELSPEEILKQVSSEKESPEAEKAIIDQINGLGLIHKGNPFKAESVEQVKELLQKGFDYTQKTMAHAEEVRLKSEELKKYESEWAARREELSQREEQLSMVIDENNTMTSILSRMKTDDPELFEHITNLYRQEVAAYEKQKPLIGKFEGEIGELKKQIGQLREGGEKEKLSKIKDSWEKDLTDVQNRLAPALNKLGVKANWDKVKETWAADATNKMSVEQALYAVHGQDIAKANESYRKMLATKNKTQSAILNRGAKSSGSHEGKETIKAAPGDYEKILGLAVNQIN